MAAFPKPTREDFLKRFAEFKTSDTDMIDLCLGDANSELYEALKEKDNTGLAEKCILYLTAHFLCAKQKSAEGSTKQLSPLVSISGGGAVLGYQKKDYSSETDEQFQSNIYGQEYLRLRSMFAVYAEVV